MFVKCSSNADENKAPAIATDRGPQEKGLQLEIFGHAPASLGRDVSPTIEDGSHGHRRSVLDQTDFLVPGSGMSAYSHPNQAS